MVFFRRRICYNGVQVPHEGRASHGQQKAEAAVSGAVFTGGDGRAPPQDPAGHDRVSGALRHLRRAQEPVRRSGAAASVRHGRPVRPRQELRLFSGRPGIPAAGAEAAHRRGAGVSLPDPGQVHGADRQAGKAHQPPQRPAAAAAGICNGSGAHPQRAAVLRRGRAAHRHQRRPEGHVPLLRLDGLRRQILPTGRRPV